MQTTTQPVTVIDADGLILGRMSSLIAKRLLKGEFIALVNAEKAIISGRRKSKVTEAKSFLEVGHLRWGPIHYRRPDRIARRTVRGMLPYKQPKGKAAYKRFRVFMGMPKDLKDQKTETLPAAQAKKLTCPYFTLAQFAKEIGWNQGE